MKKRLGVALLILLVFGGGRLKFEQALADSHRAAYFHGARLDLDMRERVGQLGFLAALSGFRSLVADMLWIEAHSAWERTAWGRMALLFNNVTTLQPRTMLFWDMAGWHMAWNASVAALQNPKEPREALRIKAQREYFQLGKEFYERGVANNPDRYYLYARLGNLYEDKLKDPCKAAEFYGRAASFKDAPAYLHRFVAYRLAECPGHEREAYEQLRALYLKGEEERLPTLLTKLRALQERLDVPAAERINIPAPPSTP